MVNTKLITVTQLLEQHEQSEFTKVFIMENDDGHTICIQLKSNRVVLAKKGGAEEKIWKSVSSAVLFVKTKFTLLKNITLIQTRGE